MESSLADMGVKWILMRILSMEEPDPTVVGWWLLFVFFSSCFLPFIFLSPKNLCKLEVGWLWRILWSGVSVRRVIDDGT
jgi:hypothetical protein